ncbi:chaperone protein dnaJ-related [Abeliophyllum distichum]|uniref:Chaperone protein dnaJ-related n=1 Tax=Abeliophyllum distichum TaxID=126358 RepID=A0ABD1Q7X9_9LAMI
MALLMSMAAHTLKLNLPCKWILPNDSSRRHVKLARCMPVQQQVDSGIICESCSGRGWLLCDFCNGQKTNVKAVNNRIYRRCPACRATGCILCSKCKVYRCITFPDYNDGEELIF